MWRAVVLLLFGLTCIAVGAWSAWRGFWTETFRGGPGGQIVYREPRAVSPLHFWGAIFYRLALVPFGTWLYWLAIGSISN